MNYRRTLLISSVALLILGAIRCLGTLPALGDYGALIGQLGALGVGALVCDLLTTVGAVASGVAALVLRKRDKGLIPWSILSFLVCAAFLISMFLLIAGSQGQYSDYSSRRGLALLAAITAIQGLSYIGIEKNWADKWNKTKTP